MSPARLVAHETLVRAAVDAAFADRVLDAAIERAGLDGRDAAFATELVYGTLRARRRLDFMLASLAREPLRKLPAATLAALRLGAYQLLELRVADHGAVHESVELVRARHPHRTAFANALLRELARRRDRNTLPDPAASSTDPLAVLAIATSHPDWLIARVARELGHAETAAFAAAGNRTPPLGLRVNRLRAEPAAVARELAAGGADVLAELHVPGALAVRNAGSPARLRAFAAGEVTVQDPAAQLVGHFAAPAPGALVLDACAAPGGKATHLAELMHDRGRVVAVDSHPGKLRLVGESAARLGLGAVVTAVADATDAAALRAALDAAGGEPGAAPTLILIDAPCSGTGTLRRNPELRERDDRGLAALTALQDRILDACASLMGAATVLVYAVCSVTTDEGRDRVLAAIARHPELTLASPPHAWLAPYLEPLAGGHVLRTWPQRHDMDGFFAARLERRRAGR